MTTARDVSCPLRRPDRFFIGGGWAVPSSTTTLDVIDPSTEGVYLRVPRRRSNRTSRTLSRQLLRLSTAGRGRG